MTKIKFTIGSANLGGSVRISSDSHGWVRAELLPWNGEAMTTVVARYEDYNDLKKVAVRAVEKLRRTVDAPEVLGHKGATGGFITGNIGDCQYDEVRTDFVSTVDALNFYLAKLGWQEIQA